MNHWINRHCKLKNITCELTKKTFSISVTFAKGNTYTFSESPNQHHCTYTTGNNEELNTGYLIAIKIWRSIRGLNDKEFYDFWIETLVDLSSGRMLKVADEGYFKVFDIALTQMLGFGSIDDIVVDFK